MSGPEPLIVPWQGRILRIRHDDPGIGPYTPSGARLRAAVNLASDVEGLRLVLASTVGDRYRVKVADEREGGRALAVAWSLASRPLR